MMVLACHLHIGRNIKNASTKLRYHSLMTKTFKVFTTHLNKTSNPQPPSKNDIELKEKEATQKKRLKEVKIATRRHKIPLPHNAT